MTTTRNTPSADPDHSFLSTLLLAWGFVGYMAVSAIATTANGWTHPAVWYALLTSILVITALFQSIPTAAYNGLMAALFFNFFFSSPARTLSFASAQEVRTAVSLVAIGVASSVLIGVVRRGTKWSANLRRDPLPSANSFQWRSGPASVEKKEESRWMH